jgi:hypothetical protein
VKGSRRVPKPVWPRVLDPLGKTSVSLAEEVVVGVGHDSRSGRRSPFSLTLVGVLEHVTQKT